MTVLPDVSVLPSLANCGMHDLPLYRRWPDSLPSAGRLGGQDWPRLAAASDSESDTGCPLF